MLERKHDQLGYELEAQQEAAVPDLDAGIDDHVGDDLLRLMFISCHPVLSTEAQVALTLRLLGGLTTDEIARAFLVPEPTVAQRIVRAKRTLADARVPFEVPRGKELEARLSLVLNVIYLISTKATRPPLATTGSDPPCVKTPSASGAFWPSSRLTSARCTASSRSWKFRRRARGLASARRESRFFCSTKTELGGTSCSSVAGLPPLPALSASDR